VVIKRWRGVIAAMGGVAALALGAAHIRAGFGSDRTLSLYNIHTKETVTVAYKKGGKYIPDALDKLNWAFRDWRKNEATKMDPELFDLLWEIHTELGSREPIHVISGYRAHDTNEMLRQTVGGQASQSRHILGKAADVQFPDVPLKQLRYSALVREKGGVGYYPTSAIPFVHVDTGRVRHWPRLPRYELALLFPDANTRHVPTDGKPITSQDVRVAQAKHKDVATQVAAFFSMRDMNRGTAIAVAEGRQPQAAGRQVAALAPAAVPTPKRRPQTPAATTIPARFTPPSAEDRNRLMTLASLAAEPPAPQLVVGPRPAVRPGAAGSLTATGQPAPLPPAARGPAPYANRQLAAIDPRDLASSSPGTPQSLTDGGWSNGFISAPAFDDEHPDELSYRPFPIAPLLTASASADDPALSGLRHPDVARTVDLLAADANVLLPLRLTPGSATAARLWAQEFRGDAVNLKALYDAYGTSPATGRKVLTSAR
jgi:uncharacterized protein YcbK (DUF882 family)